MLVLSAVENATMMKIVTLQEASVVIKSFSCHDKPDRMPLERDGVTSSKFNFNRKLKAAD
jgi:hypothetical protein